MLGLHQNDSIKMESHAIGELLKQVAQLEAEQAAQKEIQLQTEYEDLSLKMDEELMESLIVTLTDNALHATEPVSYTHLDVYKRQTLNCDGHEYTVPAGTRIKLTPGESITIYPYTVSYTHLCGTEWKWYSGWT